MTDDLDEIESADDDESVPDVRNDPYPVHPDDPKPKEGDA